MLRSKFFTAALLAATALLAAPAASQAAFRISVNDGAGDSFLADITTTGLTLVSGTGTTATQAGLTAALSGYTYGVDPTVPGAASASFTLRLGEYLIQSQFALTNGNAPLATGSTTVGALRISNTNVFRSGSSSTVGDLMLAVSADYSIPIFNPYTFSSTFSGQFPPAAANGQTSLWTSTYAQGSTLFPVAPGATQTVTVSQIGGVNVVVGALNQSQNVPGPAPFVLTESAEIKLFGQGSINSGGVASQVTNATPAPAGVVLVASVLPFVALLRRRLRKSDVVTAA